jgi:hypothetical protein
MSALGVRVCGTDSREVKCEARNVLQCHFVHVE